MPFALRNLSPLLPQTLEAVTILLSWLWPALWQKMQILLGIQNWDSVKSSAHSISWTKDMENWVRIVIFGHVYPEKQRWRAWQEKNKARPEGDADTKPTEGRGRASGMGASAGKTGEGRKWEKAPRLWLFSVPPEVWPQAASHHGIWDGHLYLHDNCLFCML